MENEAKVSNVEINNQSEVINDDFHYVGVIFENNNYSYGGKRFSSKLYEYKTKKDLKEGQVIKIKTMYGESNVVIAKENIPEEELQFKELDKIKEI